MTEIVTEQTLAEYEDFIENHRYGHFMQSSRWGKLKTSWKWEALLSRGEDGAIRGALAVLIRRAPGLPFTLMYGCRGPVCDPRDHETIADLVAGVRGLAKRYHSYTLKLDPPVRSGDTEFMDYMLSLGFKSVISKTYFGGIQPRYVFWLDIEGKSEEEVQAGFHPKWRYNIRLAQKKGVTVEIKNGDGKALDDFTRLMNDTGVRDNFATRQRWYFESMLENLGEHARLYMAYHEGAAIAGALAIRHSGKVWYLYGASGNEQRNLMPNYLVQWEMMRWAIGTGCRLYDFRGVSGYLSEDHPLYGIYRFKKGFGGELVEFVGELDLVLNPPVNLAMRAGIKFYRWVRRIIFRKKHQEQVEGGE